MNRTTRWSAAVAVGLATATVWSGGLFSVSVQEEKELGAKAAAEVERKARLERGGRADRVARIGVALAAASDNKDYAFTFKVISDKQVNAFAIPGGHVYIYSGMLDRLTNDDQLAGVLAHEVTHVTHRHFARQYKKNATRQAGLAVLLGLTRAGKSTKTAVAVGDMALTNDYSRQDETDADMSGMELMKKASFNPRGMVEMLQALQKVSGDSPKLLAWTSDHPQIGKRVSKAEEKEAQLK